MAGYSEVAPNNAYDRVTLGIGSPFFSVAGAKANIVSVLGNLTLEDTIDLSITTTDPQIPQSCLDFYLQRLDREPNLAALVIANGMTICFVGYNNKYTSWIVIHTTPSDQCLERWLV